MRFSITLKRDIQNSNAQHKDTCSILMLSFSLSVSNESFMLSIVMLSIVMLSIVMLSVVYTRNFVVVLVTNLPPGYKKLLRTKSNHQRL